MKDIFNDGVIVATIIMPKEMARSSHSNRRYWAMRRLGEYLTKFYGPEAANLVSMSRSHERITGTKATIEANSQRITYMMVEPRNNLGKNEILIYKLVEDLNEAGILDEIDYQFGPGMRSRRPINQPFAELASIREGLPKTRRV